MGFADEAPPDCSTYPGYQRLFGALASDDQDWFMNKRAPQLPPVDLDTKSRTLSLQRPTDYAIEKFRKFEYVPLWYFTEQGCQAADKDNASMEDLLDVTANSDNLFLCIATTFNSDALSDEQLTWEQFMDANRLFCR